jgi:hypothetical protein
MKNTKAFLMGILLMAVLGIGGIAGALADRLFVIKPLDYIVARSELTQNGSAVVGQKVLTEESVVIDVAEKASPSVVTVSVTQNRAVTQPFFMDPFGFFGDRSPTQGEVEEIEQDIGTRLCG